MTTPLTDGASQEQSQEQIQEEIRTVERLRRLREQVTTQMGGPEAVGAIHAAGRRTAREHIAEFVDPGSFGEIGTFATFVDKVTAPDPGPYGGGIIGGHATLDGRPVTVAVDDDSVTAPARRSTGKAARLYQMALKQHRPYIEILQGDTVPDLASRPGKTGTASATMTIVTAAAPRRVMAPMARASTAATAANSPVPMITFTSVAVDTGAA